MKTAVQPTLKAHLWRFAFIAFSLLGVHQNLQAKESSGMQWTVTRHTWGEDLSGSLQGAGGIGGLLSSTVDGSPTKNKEQRTTNGFHYDSNGNVILLTNAKAQETARYSYDAFGKTLTATGPAAEQNRYQFSTKPVEEKSGLVYYGYRWYDPLTGRWPSRDPIGERGGFNLYAAGANGYPYKADVLGLQEFYFNSLSMDDAWWPAQVTSTTEDLCNEFRAGILTIKLSGFMSINDVQGVTVVIDGGHGVISSNGSETWVEKSRTLNICPQQLVQRIVPITIADPAGPITISSHPAGGMPKGRVLSVNLSYKCTSCGDGGCGGQGTVANFELTYTLGN